MNSVKDYLTHHMKKDVQEGFKIKDGQQVDIKR